MPIEYITHAKNPVEGQAILNNITRPQRVLRYRENNQVFDRIQRGMPYYEVETQEIIGEPSDNLVLRGEFLSACAYLKSQNSQVDLVYIAPPFASGAWHSSTEIKIDKLGYVIKDGVKTKTFWDGKIYADKQPKRLKVRNISGDETVKNL